MFETIKGFAVRHATKLIVGAAVAGGSVIAVKGYRAWQAKKAETAAEKATLAKLDQHIDKMTAHSAEIDKALAEMSKHLDSATKTIAQIEESVPTDSDVDALTKELKALHVELKAKLDAATPVEAAPVTSAQAVETAVAVATLAAVTEKPKPDRSKKLIPTRLKGGDATPKLTKRQPRA